MHRVILMKDNNFHRKSYGCQGATALASGQSHVLMIPDLLLRFFRDGASAVCLGAHSSAWESSLRVQPKSLLRQHFLLFEAQMRGREAGPPAEANCAVLGGGVSSFSYPEGGPAAASLTTPRCGGRSLGSPATPSSGDAARQDGLGAQPITRAPCGGESLPMAPETLPWTANLRIPS